jgi:hypothetical protein
MTTIQIETRQELMVCLIAEGKGFAEVDCSNTGRYEISRQE